VVPDERNFPAVSCKGILGEIAPFGIPFRMTFDRVVPLHDDRPVTGIEVVANNTCRIRLLIDKSNLWSEAKQTFICLIAKSQIRCVDLSRDQWSDKLDIATADKFARAFTQQGAEFAQPLRIDFSYYLKGVCGSLDS